MDSKLSKPQISSCYDDLASSGKFPDNTYLHKTFLQMINSEMALSGSLNILDAGGGAGFFGLHFASLGHKVTISDISIEALKVAEYRSRKCNLANNVSTVVGDIEKLPFPDESFDIAVCMFVFSHLNNPDKAFCELKRVLRSKGRLIISFENKYWHVLAQGLIERYESAISLFTAEIPIIKAYDILPPIRLYTVSEIKKMCDKSNLKISFIKGTRHVTSFQEYLKGIGTTDTERLLHNNSDAMEFENLLSNTDELLPLARHSLVCCEKP